MKYKKILSMFLVGALCLSVSACSKEEVPEPNTRGYLDAALEKLEEVENMSSTMIVNCSASDDGTGEVLEMVLEASADISKDPFTWYINMESEAQGESVGGTEFYIGEDGDIKNFYEQYGEDWYKEEITDENIYLYFGHFDVSEILKIFLVSADNAVAGPTEELNGVENVRKVDAVISEEFVASTLVYTGVFSFVNLGGITEEYLVGLSDMPISFWIDEDGNVLKYEFDASEGYQAILDCMYEMYKDIEGFEDISNVTINEYSFSVTINETNFENEIIIPQEILDAPSVSEVDIEELEIIE